MLRLIFKVIKVIQSNDSPKRLAWGFAYGGLLGLVPGFTIYHIVLFIGVYLFSVNIGMTLLSYAFFKVVTVFISRYTHIIGYKLLVDYVGLKAFWTSLYNVPIIPWTKFNNTVVLGGIILSFCLFIPNYFIMMQLIKLYRKNMRDKLKEKIDKFKVVKILKGSKLVKLYGSYAKVRDTIKFRK
ncbi:MAG: hypothetical protein A2Y40_05080 [Candidatus Margulisbacteria bacterium GWF2_35_9]|nr:MAG: hypothetical protein A2Y40_05080 [Candidatus Margulisbacteria bacterium GWF2_35_9]